ncbi:hypothetical protein L1049_004906 [Liquidambar formosana]|uniref:Putative plant transposon protein domain-containing protein n=1 Tax=Liquidambar formosana TaxID=63359 RepID=A0AAP0X0U4_LIQFO
MAPKSAKNLPPNPSPPSKRSKTLGEGSRKKSSAAGTKKGQRRPPTPSDEDSSSSYHDSGEELVEPRTKARQDSQPRPTDQPSEETEPPFYLSKETEARYFKVFLNRTIIHPKVFNFDFFPQFSFREMFDSMGLTYFISLKNPSYHTLITTFYAHLTSEAFDECSSYVIGTKVNLNCDLLCNIFHAPVNALSFVETNAWPRLPGFNKLEATRLLCGDPTISQAFKPKAKDLTLECNILHKLLIYNFLPRGGSKDHVSFLDVGLLWCFLKRVPFDLGHLMIHHMKFCVDKENGVMPYGGALTTIFSHFGIPLIDAKKYIPSSVDEFTPGLMSRMGYHKVNDIWVK